MPMLQLGNVTKSYGGQVVVDCVSLQFEPGKVHVLIGPSGCGKSTLLRILLGLIDTDSGQVLAGDTALQGREWLQHRYACGYVIQEGGLFPHLTARENVSLPARYHRWSAARIAGRLQSLTELTDFPADALDRYPGQLSGGQRQRASLMRALMLDPQTLVLDEPLGALDPMIRRQLQQELKDIFRQLSRTVVMVTHDLHEAAWFADRIILMRAGRVVQAGQLTDLVAAPADPFVTEFIRAQRTMQLPQPGGGSDP